MLHHNSKRTDEMLMQSMDDDAYDIKKQMYNHINEDSVKYDRINEDSVKYDRINEDSVKYDHLLSYTKRDISDDDHNRPFNKQVPQNSSSRSTTGYTTIQSIGEDNYEHRKHSNTLQNNSHNERLYGSVIAPTQQLNDHNLKVATKDDVTIEFVRAVQFNDQPIDKAEEEHQQYSNWKSRNLIDNATLSHLTDGVRQGAASPDHHSIPVIDPSTAITYPTITTTTMNHSDDLFLSTKDDDTSAGESEQNLFAIPRISYHAISYIMKHIEINIML